MARPLDPAEAFNRQPPVPRPKGAPLRTPNVPNGPQLTNDALRQTRPALDPAEAFNRQPAVPRGTPLRTPNVPSELELAKDAMRQTRPGTPIGPNQPMPNGRAAVGGSVPSTPAARALPVVQSAPAAPAFTPETRSDVLARESMLRNQAASRASHAAGVAPTATPVAGSPAAAGGAGGNFASKLRRFPAAASKKVAGVVGKLAVPLTAGVAAYDGLGQGRADLGDISQGNFNNSTGAATGMDQRRTHWPDTPVGAMNQYAEAGNGAAQGVVSNLGSVATFGAFSPEEIGRTISGVKNRIVTAGNSALRGDFARAGEALIPGGATDEAFNQRQIPLTNDQRGKFLRQPAVSNNSTGDASTPMPATNSAATNPSGVIEINGQRLSPERMAQLESRSQSSGIDFGRPAGQQQGGDISSMLRDMMRGTGSSGGSAQGAVISAPGNDPFDKLKAEVIDAHGGGRVAKGTMARKLMEIESMRQGRQTADQQNATGMRGQDLAAQTAAANTRAGLANTMADYDVQSQAAQSSALRNKAEAAKFQSEMGEKGFDRFQKLTTGLFQKVGEDGKPTNDTAKEERFRQYLMGSDMANADGGLLTLDPQQQAALISQQRASFEMQEAANEKSGNWGGMASNRYSPATNVRDPELGDLRRGLGASTYLNQELNPFSDGNVVQQENGQVRSRSELVDDDADRLAELQNALRSRR